MRVVYVNPSFGDDFVRAARWAAKSRGRVQRHPEQALIQVAVLEQDGHECTFIEAAAQNLGEEDTLARVEACRPDLTVVHTTTPSIYSDIRCARLAKEATGCRTVLVGAHASAEPEDTLRRAAGAVDMVVRGEADYTLRDIARAVAPDRIPGISWQDGGSVRHNPPRPFLDVNELPFPAWQHIDPRWYHDAGKLYPFLTLYTGRGCHGLCTFCRETQVINGRKLRMRDAGLVADEMEYDLKLFPELREIMFETDTFTAVPDHVESVCREIVARGLHKRVQWSSNVRVDVRLDLLPLMREAGCRMLMIGFEFGTDEQLAAVRKGTTTAMAVAFARRAHELGFTLHGCFMIGAPDETRESAQKTIDFAKDLPLDTMQVSGIVVYPGTAFYEWAKANAFITAGDWTDWVDANHEQVTLLSYPQMPKEEIDYYVDKGLKQFYLRPRQMFRMLAALRSWDDVQRKLYGVQSFLDYFRKNRRRPSCESR